jgi:hypothetical protein
MRRKKFAVLSAQKQLIYTVYNIYVIYVVRYEDVKKVVVIKLKLVMP